MGSPTPADADLLDRVGRSQVRSGELALWYTGGAGYIVKTAGVTILIDPYLGPSNPPDWVRAIPPAFSAERLGGIAAVLLTHEHDDHTDPVALNEIGRRTAADIFGPESSITVAQTAGVPTDRCHIVEADRSVTVGDLLLTAIPVYDPLAQGCLGWVMETGAVTVLHCADSLYFPGFVHLGQRWSFDAMCVSVGLNPPGATFYMDESDAARAVRDAGAKVLIPQHFDLWERTSLDPTRVVTATHWYCPGTRVLPARFRRRITIAPTGAH
jgi:L-ascorbate 6-phosphate lactonase